MGWWTRGVLRRCAFCGCFLKMSCTSLSGGLLLHFVALDVVGAGKLPCKTKSVVYESWWEASWCYVELGSFC